MRKILTATAMAVLAIVLICPHVWATDYAGMSNEELAALRGTMQNASAEEHEAFRAEWRSRLQTMSAEEQQQLLGHPPNTTNFQSGPRYQEHKGNGPGYGNDGIDGGMGMGGPGRGNGGGPGSGSGGGGGGRR